MLGQQLASKAIAFVLWGSIPLSPALILGSSMVERLAVNEMVGGSSPSPRAKMTREHER